jgi:hypothetical protein
MGRTLHGQALYHPRAHIMILERPCRYEVLLMNKLLHRDKQSMEVPRNSTRILLGYRPGSIWRTSDS